MQPVAIGSVLLMFVTTLGFVAGCASHADLSSEHPSAGAGPPSILTMELPSPSTLKLPQGVVSDVFHTGSDYVGDWPRSRVWGTDEGPADYRAEVYADPIPPETTARPAYATYHFDATGFAHGSTVSVNWLATGGDGEAWVGLPDWAADAWRWHHLGPESIAHFDSEACLDDGVTYALVLLTGTTAWRLESIHLGFELPPLITSVSPLSGEAGEEVTLSALLNIDEEAVTSWDWQLDGAGSIGVSAEASPTLTLGSSGVYECSVRASNEWGETDFPFLLTVFDEGSDWEFTVVGVANWMGSSTSLALRTGSPGNPHLAYRQAEFAGIPGRLKLAYLDSGFWHTETVATFTDSMTSASLAIDSEGAAHLAYTHSVSPDADDHWYVIHAHAPLGPWLYETVAESIRPMDWYYDRTTLGGPALALDDEDRAGVCYLATYQVDDPPWGWLHQSDSLVYSGHPDPATLATTDESRIGGHAIDFGSSGNPCAAYVADAEGIRLHYTARSGDETWSDEIVEDASEWAAVTLEISPVDGQPRICYVRPGEGIRFASFDGSEWAMTTVPGTLSAGTDLSMSLDSLGLAHICYYDGTAEDLRYACRSGLSWEVSIVDDGGDVGPVCAAHPLQGQGLVDHRRVHAGRKRRQYGSGVHR